MIWRLNSVLLGCTLLAGAGLSPACVVDDFGSEDDEVTTGEVDLASYHSDENGRRLFRRETFGGNGRTCATCHPSDNGESGTLNPAEVRDLWRHDGDNPLFQHDAADVVGGDTFERVRQHATVLIPIELPATVSIAGSSAREVLLPRGIPTTMNTPALDPVLMYDGRAPNLQEQARDAIERHAESVDVTNAEVNAIAEFQQTLFSRTNLKRFFNNARPLTLPYGDSNAEKRGRRWFIDDDQTDPGMVGESKFNVCGFCHSGTMLNELSGFFVANVAPAPFPEGFRFFTALVSEFNAMGNPVYDFEYTAPDGTVTVVPSPDPGIFLQSGEAPPFGNGWFKIGSVWGIKDTAPYFHDNSSKNLEQILDHYDDAIFILSEADPVPVTLGQVDLTEQDKKDIIAYIKLL